MSSRATVLITGGAGFLGSHLCDRFIREGYRVICVDNLLTGDPGNVGHLAHQPHFTFLQGDVTDPVAFDGPVDFVLHFAGPASPKTYAQHPIHTLKVGALGTYHALGLAKAKSAMFLLASSSEVYGDPEVNPQPETYWGRVNPVGPRSVYDEAKRFAEAMTVAYHRSHGLDVRIARIFNTFGPRMRIDDGRALPTFITQALRHEPLTVHGDGSQTRSFCYVEDLVEGVYRLLMFPRNLAQRSFPDNAPLIVNLGNPDEVSILQVAREVIEITGSGSSVVFCSLPTDDPKVRCPDMTRARHLLNWSPRISRRKGLSKTIADFRDRLQSKVS